MKIPLLVLLFLVTSAFSELFPDTENEGEALLVRVRRSNRRVIECDPPCETGGHVPTCCKNHGFKKGGQCKKRKAYCNK